MMCEMVRGERLSLRPIRRVISLAQQRQWLANRRARRSDLGLLLLGGLGEISGAENLIPMDGQEPLDGAEEEPDASLAVAKEESAGGETAPPPALNRLAGDVEAFGDIFDGHDRLGGLGFAKIEGFADLLDEQTQIMLKGHAGEQSLVDPRGVVAGDSVDDKVKGISLCGVDIEQKLFCCRELRQPNVLGRERHLPTQIADLIDSEIRHESHYPLLSFIGQDKTQA